MRSLRKQVEGKVISKPEDKTWKEWYEKLSPKEHEEYLSKLGLSKSELEEFHKEMKKEKLVIQE
ncbi:MAG: hypothetical protein AB1467_04780 [Candidatus Diapherotrites archaeon]